MRALARIAVHLVIDHPTDPIPAYSAILANHAGRTLAHLDAELSEWRNAHQQRAPGGLHQHLTGTGPD